MSRKKLTKFEASKIDSHVGNRLRQKRRSANISLEVLAARLNISYQQIQKYEAGKNRISASTLYRIAHLLDVSVAYFFQDLFPNKMPKKRVKRKGIKPI